MDKNVAITKLESISRCLMRIEEKTPQSIDVLIEDHDIQDIILINLERLIQQMVDLSLIVLTDYSSVRPDTMAETFRMLASENIIDKELAENLAKAVGFRNIAVHEYQKLNWNIVWAIIRERLDDFKNFSKEIDKLI